MDTPMPSASAWTEQLTRCFKPQIVAMPGYAPPPPQAVSVKLNQNEAPESLTGGDEAWNRYPPYSHSDLIAALARQFGVTTDQILLGNGSNSLLYTVASAVIEKGDRVLISPPAFSLHQIFIRSTPVDYRQDQDALPSAVIKPMVRRGSVRLLREENVQEPIAKPKSDSSVLQRSSL